MAAEPTTDISANQPPPATPGLTKILETKNTSWGEARLWTLGACAARVLAAGVFVGLTVQFAHFGSLLSSGDYTADEWNAVLQTRTELFNAARLAAFVAVCMIIVRGNRLRWYIVKNLPGVPMLTTRGNETGRTVSAGARLWPLKPEPDSAAASSVNNVSSRLVLTLALLPYMSWAGVTRLDQYMSPSSTKYLVLVTLCVVTALTFLLNAALDILRLRAYARWPKAGRPRA